MMHYDDSLSVIDTDDMTAIAQAKREDRERAIRRAIILGGYFAEEGTPDSCVYIHKRGCYYIDRSGRQIPIEMEVALEWVDSDDIQAVPRWNNRARSSTQRQREYWEAHSRDEPSEYYG